MLAIAACEVTPALSALFDFGKPTMPRAINVLDSVVRGEILVDDPAQPTWAVVREATYGTLYFGGHVDGRLVRSVVERFRQSGDVGIGCWRDDALNDMLPPDPDYDGLTLYFTHRSPHVALQHFIAACPPAYVLRPRDERLFAASFDYDATLAAFGTV